MTEIDQLLTVARAYAEAEGIELRTVSHRVFDDGKKLAAIAAGRDIQVRRYRHAMQWFSDHWPVSGPWPTGIPRPEPAPDTPAAPTREQVA